MQKVFKVTVPMRPNFITVGVEKVSIADFKDAELKEIGAEWTRELLKDARMKRKAKRTEATPRMPVQPIEGNA